MGGMRFLPYTGQRKIKKELCNKVSRALKKVGRALKKVSRALKKVSRALSLHLLKNQRFSFHL
jgi:hypothetical protein